MRVGIATDHGGFGLKEELVARLHAAGHEIVDFGAHTLNAEDDYPDFVVPLAEAVVAGRVQRGVAICGSGVGASVCANKVAGIRAALVHDDFSAKQGVEDDHLNILCMGGRTVGPAVAWDLVQAFLGAEFSQADRHLRRLPLLILAELVVHLRMRRVGGQFFAADLIPDPDRPRFNAAVESVLRLRNSLAAELLLIVVSALLP